ASSAGRILRNPPPHAKDRPCPRRVPAVPLPCPGAVSARIYKTSIHGPSGHGGAPHGSGPPRPEGARIRDARAADPQGCDTQGRDTQGRDTQGRADDHSSPCTPVPPSARWRRTALKPSQPPTPKATPAATVSCPGS